LCLWTGFFDKITGFEKESRGMKRETEKKMTKGTEEKQKNYSLYLKYLIKWPSNKSNAIFC